MKPVSNHPLNLAVRLLLETGGLVVTGMWGFARPETWTRYLLVLLLPLLFALIWGVFAVRNDPSRSGKTVVPTPGPVRLLIELALFGISTWMLADLGYGVLAWIFGVTVVVHYAVSFGRVRWLLKGEES